MLSASLCHVDFVVCLLEIKALTVFVCVGVGMPSSHLAVLPCIYIHW
jgi:hypothetical protein